MKNLRKIKHHITKFDLEQKDSSMSWDEYFKIKEQSCHLKNCIKNDMMAHSKNKN